MLQSPGVYEFCSVIAEIHCSSGRFCKSFVLSQDLVDTANGGVQVCDHRRFSDGITSSAEYRTSRGFFCTMRHYFVAYLYGRQTFQLLAFSHFRMTSVSSVA
jgi:hypothetical protein